MKLSRSVTYALKAALQLAQNTNGRPMPCSRIAAQGSMPERFLLQILRSLVTHGILKSTRGVDGGYVLLKEASHVSLLDVIEAIEGPLDHEVNIGEGMPDQSRARLSSIFKQVTQATLDTLSSVKLADLIFDEPWPTADETASPASTNAATPAPVNSAHAAGKRIDVPSAVPQTPSANPPHSPVAQTSVDGGAQPAQGIPSASDPAPQPLPAPHVIRPTDPVSSVHPNSWTGV